MDDKKNLNSKARTFNDLEEMLNSSRIIDSSSNEFYLPTYNNSITSIQQKILPTLNGDKPTIVFGLDAINIYQFIDYFDGMIDLSNLHTLSSVFPTGSATAYSSIHFGQSVDKHGVYGSAFYNPSIRNLQLVFTDQKVTTEEKIQESPFKITKPTTLDKVSKNCCFIHVKHFSADSNLARRFMGSASSIELTATDNFERDIMNQFDSLFKITKQKKYHVNWCYLDFDTIMHQWGVKTLRTDALLRKTARIITDYINKNPEYAYIFLSDHGQIDQRDTHEFDNESIIRDCYAMKGGSGRSLYFYTNKKSVCEHIESEVGTSGLVLHRGDPLLNKIFGFNTKNIPEIGDIVAIATAPNFPSYGWNLKAEHGGLCKEELYVPFLILQND